ncbi:TrkH family potassium uptake protein [Corynebacterium poyangense]|uniref:TrkH family potassium uptake protein n=1 Tax=Corynebacterium poyangense TaxID=2684405 RepID=A0A7H0SQH3_9CORY|nr:potassium transporter TrkG [Corynebacterium poyangense]QNQ90798.1 TrkH family potassium uptake protein [Corynebacterium poyangense]
MIGSKPRLSPQTRVCWGFAGLVCLGTLFLSTPWASAGPEPVPVPDALFTATSAVSLTGLVTVDTGTVWSTAGRVTIALLIQFGGLGFMTMASLLTLAISGRLGLSQNEDAQAEGRGVDHGEVVWVVRSTILFTLGVELFIAAVLALRFSLAYPHSGILEPLWFGIFHAISSFNNAGFALQSDNMISFNTDPFILLPLALSLIIGGIGFPVLLELARRFRWYFFNHGQRRRWSLTARFTFIGTLSLIVAGTLLVLLAEWRGALSTFGNQYHLKFLNAFFAGVSPRTAGFNALDYANFHPSTLLGTDILMVIGGGTGGTAGGVKVTTAAVLGAAVLAEIRGFNSTTLGARRVPSETIRRALALLTLSLLLIVGAVTTLLFLAPQFTTDQIVFEVCSAFATVGLSTGITPDLPFSAQAVIICLMFAGRVGPLVLATAFASRNKPRYYDYPEERPSLG